VTLIHFAQRPACGRAQGAIGFDAISALGERTRHIRLELFDSVAPDRPVGLRVGPVLRDLIRNWNWLGDEAPRHHTVRRTAR
jgi:hypothetical protein